MCVAGPCEVYNDADVNLSRSSLRRAHAQQTVTFLLQSAPEMWLSIQASPDTRYRLTWLCFHVIGCVGLHARSDSKDFIGGPSSATVSAV